MLRSALVALALALALLPRPVMGQGAPARVEPSEAQVELVEKGVEAGLQDQHEAAVDYFRAALELGELNIAWLNLGRSLARLGRCEEAREAYERALRAPTVASPAPAEVRDIVARYEAELIESCTGTLVLRCAPPTLRVSIDGAAPQPCPGEPLSLSWGTHEVTWSTPRGTQRAEVAVEPGRRVELLVDEGGAPDEGGWVMPVGWTALGLGVVILGSGIAIDVAFAGDHIEELKTATAEGRLERAREIAGELESDQQLAIGLYIGGTALAAGGLGLLLAHYLGGGGGGVDAASAGAQLPQPWLPPTGRGGVQWRVLW